MINVDNLTYGQIKEIAALACGSTSTKTTAKPHPFAGQVVLCRCSAAGVHVGKLVSAEGEQVHLRDSKRLWSWEAAGGVALSGVAQHGLKGGKVDAENPEIILNGVAEIIPCSIASIATIYE